MFSDSVRHCRRCRPAPTPAEKPGRCRPVFTGDIERILRATLTGAIRPPVRRGACPGPLTAATPNPVSHLPFACSGVKALRNTSVAKAASRQAPLPFRSLDPFRALREPNRKRRDRKRPFPLRTKNCQHYPKQPLDRKSPIQVRIHLSPAASRKRTGSSASSNTRLRIAALSQRSAAEYLRFTGHSLWGQIEP